MYSIQCARFYFVFACTNKYVLCMMLIIYHLNYRVSLCETSFLLALGLGLRNYNPCSNRKCSQWPRAEGNLLVCLTYIIHYQNSGVSLSEGKPDFKAKEHGFGRQCLSPNRCFCPAFHRLAETESFQWGECLRGGLYLLAQGWTERQGDIYIQFNNCGLGWVCEKLQFKVIVERQRISFFKKWDFCHRCKIWS